MSKINQTELEKILLSRLEAEVDLSAEPDKLELIRDGLKAFTAIIMETLVAGEEVKINNFGRFWLCQVEGENRNPQNGERLGISVDHKLIFTPAKAQVRIHGA